MREVVLLDWSEEPHLGVRTLAQSLKSKGIPCSIVGVNSILSGALRTAQEWDKAYTRELFKDLRRGLSKDMDLKNAKYIGVSMYDWHHSAVRDIKIARLLRVLNPSAKIIGGGPAFSSNPYGFFKQGGFDYAIAGAGEEKLPALIKALQEKKLWQARKVPGVIYRKNGQIIQTPNKDFAPPKLRKMIYASKHAGLGLHSTGVTFTSRGCPRGCVFCIIPSATDFLSVEEVIKGLKRMARDKEIKRVGFTDDQIFHNKNRSEELLTAIVKNGLHKRFVFSAAATVDSFLKHGQVDEKMVAMVKKANFVIFNLGTEALNDTMLGELKGGRYTAQQAINVNSALIEKGIFVGNFMLAGGINTTPADFIESYYRAMARGVRTEGARNTYEYLSIIYANKNTPIHSQAVNAGTLFAKSGVTAKEVAKGKVGARFALPKDPLLKELFASQLRRGQYAFGPDDINSVVALAKAASARGDELIVPMRKLLYLKGVIESKKMQLNKNRDILRIFVRAIKAADKGLSPEVHKQARELQRKRMLELKLGHNQPRK